MSGFESTSHDLNEGLVFSMCAILWIWFFIYVNGYGYRDVEVDAKLKILRHILKGLFSFFYAVSCTLASKHAKNIFVQDS
jgi:hypothetical protein